MAEKSAIAWTDATFNSWWGCQRVSPGCDNCYAERDAHRYYPQATLWGPQSERRLFGDKHWHEPLKWNARAERLGIRLRVFCASMADVFDNHPGVAEPRVRLWELIQRTQCLDWLLLTKRVTNVPKMLPPDWGDGYPNVWLGISVVNQEEADRDVPRLIAIPARTRFLSCEPLLAPMTLFRDNEGLLRGPAVVVSGGRTADTPDYPSEGYDNSYAGIDWAIVGGESGPAARPFHVDWARSLLAQCRLAGIACFVKQLGAHVITSGVQRPGQYWPQQTGLIDTGHGYFRKHLANRKGEDISEWPEDLRVQEWPEVS